MSILLENCQDIYVLKEAYYGKPKEFVLIEKKLEKIIEMIHIMKTNPTKAVNINTMPELKEIEELFTKFFKNKETSITFYAPSISPGYNAFTIPSSLAYFKKDRSNERIARAEDLFINVNVDIGLVHHLELTTGELMSIILHEIGHCFDASMFALLSNISISYWFRISKQEGKPEQTTMGIDVPHSIMQTLTGMIMSSAPIAKLHQMLNRFLSSVPVLNKLISDLSTIFTDIQLFLGTFSSLSHLSMLFKYPPLTVMRLLDPRNLFGYGMEKFADSFATSYGYGPDAASAFKKMNINKGLFLNEKVAKIPLLNLGYDFAKTSMKAATLMFDPHPENATRIVSQLNKLKKDLNDPKLDPKVKKELMENIKEMEDYINDVVLNIEDDSNKGRIFSYIWNWLIIKGFNGKIDPRELFEAAWNHEM